MLNPFTVGLGLAVIVGFGVGRLIRTRPTASPADMVWGVTIGLCVVFLLGVPVGVALLMWTSVAGGAGVMELFESFGEIVGAGALLAGVGMFAGAPAFLMGYFWRNDPRRKVDP